MHACCSHSCAKRPAARNALLMLSVSTTQRVTAEGGRACSLAGLVEVRVVLHVAQAPRRAVRDLPRWADHQREALDVPDGLLLHIGHLRGLALGSGLPLAARAIAGVVAAVAIARTIPILACLVLPILHKPNRADSDSHGSGSGGTGDLLLHVYHTGRLKPGSTLPSAITVLAHRMLPILHKPGHRVSGHTRQQPGTQLSLVLKLLLQSCCTRLYVHSCPPCPQHSIHRGHNISSASVKVGLDCMQSEHWGHLRCRCSETPVLLIR